MIRVICPPSHTPRYNCVSQKTHTHTQQAGTKITNEKKMNGNNNFFLLNQIKIEWNRFEERS